MNAPAAISAHPSILVVDGDIVSRHVIADYLRHCGYGVVEAAGIEEAFVGLCEPTLTIDVILCDESALGSAAGLVLSDWVRANRPDLEVRIAGGTDMAAETAAELCESGPLLTRPSEPDAVIEYIKRLRARRLTQS